MGRATQGEKAEIVRELRAEGYQLKHLLTAIGLARSTYYFEMRKENPIKARNKDLTAEIRDIFEHHKGRYGVRRVYMELVNRGHKINHKRVQRIMHETGLEGKRPKEKYHSYRGDVGKVAGMFVPLITPQAWIWNTTLDEIYRTAVRNIQDRRPGKSDGQELIRRLLPQYFY